MSESVFNRSEHHQLMEDKRVLLRALWGGTPGMHARSVEFLPPEQGERVTGTDSEYARRLQRTILVNAYRRAIQKMVGKVGSVPIKLGPDVPPEIRGEDEFGKGGLAEDIDMCGRNLHSFACDSFESVVGTEGLGGILVDFVSVPEAPTLEDEMQLGMRPYWVWYPGGRILETLPISVNGREVLGRVRLLEYVTRPVGKWGQESISRVRVLYRGDPNSPTDSPEHWARYEIYEHGSATPSETAAQLNSQVERSFASSTNASAQADILVESGPMIPHVEIPFVEIPAEKTGFWDADMACEDLAFLVLSHYRKKSDLDNILHVANVPVTALENVDEEEFDSAQWGPLRVLFLPQGGKASILEHKGMAINHAREDLKDTEEQIRLFSMEPLIPREKSRVSATGEIQHGNEAHCALQDWALSLQDALEEALRFTAIWIFEEDGGSVRVNTKWGLSRMEREDLETLKFARKERDLSQDTFWRELQRRDILSEEFDPKTEKTKIAAEPPRETVDPPGVEPKPKDTSQQQGSTNR